MRLARCAGPALRADRRTRGGASAVADRSPRLDSPPAGAGRAGNRHSRRVALLKRVLPAIGLALLLLIAVWPRLAPLWERMRLAFPAIDLREARELRMVNPRYAGVDRLDRPVCRDRRGRSAGARSAGSDVAASAAGRRSRRMAAPISSSPRRPASTSRRPSFSTCSARSRWCTRTAPALSPTAPGSTLANNTAEGERPGRGARALRRRQGARVPSSTRATRSCSPAVRPAADRRKPGHRERRAGRCRHRSRPLQRGRGRGEAGAIAAALGPRRIPGRQAGRAAAVGSLAKAARQGRSRPPNRTSPASRRPADTRIRNRRHAGRRAQLR